VNTKRLLRAREKGAFVPNLVFVVLIFITETINCSILNINVLISLFRKNIYLYILSRCYALDLMLARQDDRARVLEVRL